MLKPMEDINDEHVDIPEAENRAIVRMKASKVARICHELDNIGDTVRISVRRDELRFSTGGDIGPINIFCRRNTAVDHQEQAVDVEQVLLNCTLASLTEFINGTPLAAQVTISMSIDTPIVADYEMGNNGHIRFHLTPQFREADDENEFQEYEIETETDDENGFEEDDEIETETDDGNEFEEDEIETDDENEPNGY